jgi:hypothetical protein
VVGEARHRDGQGVARPGRALGEGAAVVGGGEDGAGTGAAGVEADDEVVEGRIEVPTNSWFKSLLITDYGG